MKNLEMPHKSVVYWHKRQSLNEIRKQKPMFEQLMAQTRQCMELHPDLANDITGAIQCETIHPQTLSQYTNFTFHTHPSDITYPSEVDKKTTKNLKKQYLAIGHVPTLRTYVYDIEDNYTRPVLVI